MQLSGGVITEKDLPLIVNENTQDVTVDSINVTKESSTRPNAVGISGGRTLTVNKDLTVSTSSSSTSSALQILAVNPDNNKFDPSSSLHVKGNLNVFNLNKNTEIDLEDHVLLTNLANTKVDGNVNLKSHAIYLKTTDAEGNEHISRSNGYNVVMFHGNSTIGKDLNVDKAYFSVSRFPDQNNTKDDIQYVDGTGFTTVNGNAIFTDEGELTVAYGHLNVKGNLTFDNGKFNLSSEVRDDDGNAIQTGQDASINVGGDLTMSGVSDNRQIIYNEVSGNSTSLNVAGDVNLSGTNNIHAYDNSELNFEKDLNIESTEVRDIFCVSEGAVGNIKGDMKVTGTTEDGHFNYYDMRNSGTLNVAGNVSFEGTNNLHVFDKSELNVGKNASFNEGEFSVTDNSNAKIDGDLTLNHVADTNIWNRAADGSSITVGGNLSLSGLYKEGTGDFSTSASGDEYHRNRFFASGEGSTITVKGNTTVSNNAELFAESYSNPIDNEDHDKYIDKSTLKDLGRANFEGDVNLSTNAKLGSYNAGEVTVEGNVNAESGGNLQAWDSDATLTIKGDAKFTGTDSRIQAGRTGSIKILGNTKLQDGLIGLDNKGSLTVGGDLTTEGSSISANNSTINVGKDFNLDNKVDGADAKLSYLEGATVNVDGNFNMDGQFVAGPHGDLDNDEDWNAYYKNRFVLSKGGSSLDVKGDVNLNHNSHLKVESYWGDWGEGATAEIPEFDKATVAHVAGNVTVDNNSYLDSGHSAELTVDGNVTVKNGSQFGAWLTNDKATIVKGNVKVSDANSKIESGNRGETDIGGNLEVSNVALANAWSQGSIKVAGNASFDSSELKSEQNSSVSVGSDLSLTKTNVTLADNGVLNVAGNLNGKGSYIDEKNTALSVGKNVKLDGSSLQVKDSTFTVNGNYEGVNTALNANGKTAVRVDKDLTVSGKNELITGAFDGASLKVGGTATVSDLVRFTADRDASIEIGNNLNLNSTLSDASDASRESAGIYNKSTMKVGGDVNVLSDSLLKADFDSSIEIGGDLNVKVDSHRNEIVGAYNNSSIKVKGNLKADRSSSYKENADINSGMSSTIDVNGNAKLTGNSKFNIFDKSKVNVGGDLEVSRDAGNDVWTNLSDNSSLNVEGNFTSDKSSLSAYENSSLNVGKNLTLTNTVDENHEIYLEKSALNVNGDVNLKGLYKDHAYSTDEDTTGAYYRNKIFVSGVGSSYKIGGDLNLLDNSNFGLETASNVPGDDPSDTIIKDNFDKVATGLVAGNVNIKNNSRFGVYQSAEATVNGNITATNGGVVASYNSGAALTVKGDVNVSDKLSRLETGNIGSIDVDGKVAVENGATAYIGKKGNISATKGFSVNNATLEIENGKLVLSGEDAVLDLTQGGVLKTDEAGSISIEKGASVESLKEALLSDDTKTTAAGVAEKTFEADALSKVHLTNLGEVTLDEAQRLHGVLFNSETGILDLKINLPTDDNGNVGFEDAVKVAGTTAAEDKTITDVDTSDKKLSDLTSSDLSWGSASLKDGQTDLDLGSGNLILNNPESNNGSFVSTADGSVGNITMDKDANLALNGTGSIGNVNTTENGTGDILVGNDKAGTVTANNLGTEDKAFGSVSVGAGSKVSVKDGIHAAKVALSKASEVISSVINSPELKAIGDDIKIKAEKSVLGGLISGNNSTLESKSLELADNFNVLGGAKVKAKNLSLKGKMLFADPDWNSNASVVVANNLSGTDGDVLDGALVAGQNSLVAVSDTLDENSAAVLAKATLSQSGITALGYVGKDITVASNGSITIDGSLSTAPATVEDNSVTVAANSALVLADNSKVSFESADGKVTNDGTIVVSSDTLANNSKITAFSGDNVTVSGKGSFDVSSALFRANSNGDGTLTVSYDENKANQALYGTDATVAQSIKAAVSSGVAVNKGTILGDLVNVGNSSNTSSTLSQLTRLGTLSGSIANAKLATDNTLNAIDSRLGSSGVKTNTQATAQSNKLTVWVQPVFSRQSSSSLDAGNTEYGIKTNLRGGVAGLDVSLGDNFIQGAAITVGSGNSSSKNIKSVSGDFDYYGFNLYGAYVNDEIKLSYDLGYTKVSNDATAYNSLGKFTSDIDTKVFTLGIKGAYTFNTSYVDITPHLGVRYAKYDSDDYTATSGLYSVNNEGASSSLVSFPVGVSFSKDISLSSWTVVPTVNLEVIPVTGDKDVDTKSAFDGVVTSVNTKLHDGINYSTFVGLDTLYGENFSLGISYNYTGSKNVDDHSVNASVRYTF